MPTPHITLRELIHDTARVHGWRWTAEYFAPRMTFTHFYWLAFGRLPRRT